MRIIAILVLWILCASVTSAQQKPKKERFSTLKMEYYTLEQGGGLQIAYSPIMSSYIDTVRVQVNQYTEFEDSAPETIIYVSLLTNLDCDCHEFYGRPTRYGDTHKIIVCSTYTYNIAYVSLRSLTTNRKTEFYIELKNNSLRYKGLKSIQHD